METISEYLSNIRTNSYSYLTSSVDKIKKNPAKAALVAGVTFSGMALAYYNFGAIPCEEDPECIKMVKEIEKALFLQNFQDEFVGPVIVRGSSLLMVANVLAIEIGYGKLLPQPKELALFVIGVSAIARGVLETYVELYFN